MAIAVGLASLSNVVKVQMDLIYLSVPVFLYVGHMRWFNSLNALLVKPCGLRIYVEVVKMDIWMHVSFKLGQKGSKNANVKHYFSF